MAEIYLILSLTMLSLMALGVCFYPLYRAMGLKVLWILPLLASLLVGGYMYWGGWHDWASFEHKQRKLQEARAMLKHLKSPDLLIKTLEKTVKLKQHDAKAWFLLGKLYSNQAHWLKAKAAFAQAHRLNTQNEQYTVYYANALWQLNKQRFTPAILKLFQQLLDKNPNQPDALAMLAMSAYQTHDYKQAITYWRRLLRLVPPNSAEAQALINAISKAEQKN